MPVERASPPIVNKVNGDHVSCCRPKPPFARGTVLVVFVLSRIYPQAFRIQEKIRIYGRTPTVVLHVPVEQARLLFNAMTWAVPSSIGDGLGTAAATG